MTEKEKNDFRLKNFEPVRAVVRRVEEDFKTRYIVCDVETGEWWTHDSLYDVDDYLNLIIPIKESDFYDAWDFSLPANEALEEITENILSIMLEGINFFDIR